MTCNACSLPPGDRVALDAALQAGGSPLHLAQRFGLSRAAIRRHAENHLTKTAEAADDTPEDKLLEELEKLRKYVNLILSRNLKEDPRDMTDANNITSLRSIREAARLLNQAAQISTRLARSRMATETDLRLDGTFQAITQAAARALRDCPACRAALSRELAALRPKKLKGG